MLQECQLYSSFAAAIMLCALSAQFLFSQKAVACYDLLMGFMSKVSDPGLLPIFSMPCH